MIEISISLSPAVRFIRRHQMLILTLVLTCISLAFSFKYQIDGTSLAYNDARSHLDIGRRVVEGLKPGLAQLGSVWLPLPHLLMLPTVWQDFMWHSGLAGAVQSMLAFISTGILIYKFLQELKVGSFGRWFGVAVFVANLNSLYLQSTAMTEMLLIATMTAGCYYLLVWFNRSSFIYLVVAGFFIMLSTLVRYDGWFLLIFSGILVFIHTYRQKGYSVAEGTTLLFSTLAGLGIGLWFLWNLLIFKDPLYFAFGPFSAHTQQAQLAAAGDLRTAGNIWLSAKSYTYALLYNSYTLPAVLAVVGFILLCLHRRLRPGTKLAAWILLTPLFFNIIALFFGHSVLFVPEVAGSSWFNVRYGLVMLPSIAVFLGFLIDKLSAFRWTVVILMALVTFFAFASGDTVTLEDALIGSSGKNVTEVSGWLKTHASSSPDLILISAASHDAIIFSSGLPMRRFIHEGTGKYWQTATNLPDHWARWIIMRTHDNNDLTWKFVSRVPGFAKYELVGSYPFADIYQLKSEYISQLPVQPVK